MPACQEKGWKELSVCWMEGCGGGGGLTPSLFFVLTSSTVLAAGRLVVEANDRDGWQFDTAGVLARFANALDVDGSDRISDLRF